MTSIALVGASSQIARDLIRSFASQGRGGLLLYVRDLAATSQWLRAHDLSQACSVHSYETYGEIAHDAVLNFVGVGDPRRAAEMGASILALTHRFDEMILTELARHPERRYLFLSSGAAYGHGFASPANAETEARIALNRIAPQDHYGVAKLYAEVRHRASPGLAIVDLRVFNYFSRTQDIEARFLITDILRSIRDGHTLLTSSDYLARDFMHPADFHRLVECVLASAPRNCALDCYTREPVDKPTLLGAMQQRFGLRYEVVSPVGSGAVDATGFKSHYYSLNRLAGEFGYQPGYSSLEGVIEEASAILH